MIGIVLDLLSEHVSHVLYLLLSCEENQDVSFSFGQMNLKNGVETTIDVVFQGFVSVENFDGMEAAFYFDGLSS